MWGKGAGELRDQAAVARVEDLVVVLRDRVLTPMVEAGRIEAAFWTVRRKGPRILSGGESNNR